MTSRITLYIRADLTPGQAGELLSEILDREPVTLLSLHAREIKRMGRAPLSDETKEHVLSLRQAGGTYEAIAEAADISRASVIKICNTMKPKETKPNASNATANIQD